MAFLQPHVIYGQWQMAGKNSLQGYGLAPIPVVYFLVKMQAIVFSWWNHCGIILQEKKDGLAAAVINPAFIPSLLTQEMKKEFISVSVVTSGDESHLEPG